MKRLTLACVAMGLSVGVLMTACQRSQPPLPDEGAMPSLASGGTWFNSPPLTDADLRGKVVLVDFWTYSCINCIRAMPYVKAWYAKYKDDGFVVVGIHAPEFDFEHDSTNVSAAINRLGITHPVVLDNDRKMWKAFENKYWPAHYFVDAKGRIRYHHFGEGEYQKSEQVIQQLLAEAAESEEGIVYSKGRKSTDTSTLVAGEGATAAADFANVKSHETYLGSNRAKGMTNPEKFEPGVTKKFQYPSSFALNDWALQGPWLISRQFAETGDSASGITYRFHSRDLNLVLGLAGVASADAKGVKFRVTIDGMPPGSAAGMDIDSLGYGVVTDDRMYQLIRQKGAVKELTFTITFFGPKVRVYAFTFG